MFSPEQSLRTRLMASMALFIAILLLTGLYAVNQATTILKEFDAVSEVYDANEREVLLMQIRFKEQVQEWKDVLLRGDRPELLRKHWEADQRLEAEIQLAGPRLLERVAGTAAAPYLQQFLAAHAQMSARYREALEAFVASHYDSRVADTMVLGIDREPKELLDQAAARIVADAEEYSARTEAQAWQHSMLNFALIVVALSAGLVFFLISLKRHVLVPISGLSHFAHQFASGHYGLRIPHPSRDEIGTVIQAFNHASDEIQKLVTNLRASEAQYRDLIEGIDAIVWVMEPESRRFTFVSPSAQAILGYPPERWLESQAIWESYFHPDYQAEGKRRLAAIIESGEGELEHPALKADGGSIWLQSRIRGITSAEGARRLLGIVVDITRLKEAEARTEYLATHDKLTGLPNRHLLMDRLEQAIAHAQRSGRQVGLLQVDLDRFNVVNESLGHRIADAAIRQVADRLKACVRRDDTVAHLGADEFSVVLGEITKPEELLEIVCKLQASVAEPLVVEEHTFELSCGIGLGLFPKDAGSAEGLFKNASAALRRAKQSGKASFRFYTEDMNSRALERFKLESALREAVERQELLLHYQPQVNIHTGQLVGCEALVRWRHPKLGLVSPAEFIPLAEETGLILPIGDWVLREACRQNKEWQERGSPAICVAVNLSARQFAQPNLVRDVADALAESGLEPHYLELEITESVVMHDVESVIATLHALKGLGVKLAIDDFGTGYSSLSYLKRFPIDKLKIDRSFVKDISVDSNDEAIVSAVIAMAQSMDLQVIAEGVEDERQLDYLRARACDEAQGYYFGRPVEARQFAFTTPSPKPALAAGY